MGRGPRLPCQSEPPVYLSWPPKQGLAGFAQHANFLLVEARGVEVGRLFRKASVETVSAQLCRK